MQSEPAKRTYIALEDRLMSQCLKSATYFRLVQYLSIVATLTGAHNSQSSTVEPPFLL